VTRVASAGGPDQQVVYCVGADDLTRGHEAAFLTQLDTIRPVDPRQTRLVPDTSGGYARAKLFLEAQLRQMPLTDPEPHTANMGAFEPMGYQREAVQRAIGQLRPRLLLADAVGLGKTIEVGMILTELLRRGQADRVLILAKKSMLSQFQAELWNRFTLPLIRLDSVGLARLQLKIPASKNPFEVYHRIIMSIDTLKDIGRYSHFLEATRWDVVVIDEAHNVSGGSNPENHLSFRLARRLARRTNSMLLTTATPHNGKRETFGRLISLLDPSAIPDPKLREYDAADIKPFFLMRFKEDVRAEAGDNFSERHVVPLEQSTGAASAMEDAVYRQLSDIRRRILDRTLVGDVIVQWGLYKAFLSSPEACRSTAEKRRRHLQSKDPDGAEAQAIDALLTALDGQTIVNSTRFQLLLGALEELSWNGRAASPRLLVFTESRITQDHLARALAAHFSLRYSERPEDQAGQPLAIIHGGMADVILADTIESFGTGSSPIRLLLATDVASEGVNLHHQCHHIIHYDLPWSIITLVQRNGRIDRFGQRHSPVIRYLMVHTQAGFLDGDSEIFRRLVDKVEEINRSTRSGESVLKLYDAEKEEEHIATQGLLAGNTAVLEQGGAALVETTELETLLQTATADGHADWLAHLMGGEAPADAAEVGNQPDTRDNSRVRLLDDATFLERGYQLLADSHPEGVYPALARHGDLWVLNPPPDLARRLGAPGSAGAMVYGATAVPEESWAEDGHLYLTTDVARVNQSILAAQAQQGQWARELLMTEQHPALQWLAERLMMLMQRGEAPLIVSPHLESGELLFCFIGQVSSRAGTPLIVDTHAVSYRRGGAMQMRPLRDALAAARFDELVNTGRGSNLSADLLSGFVASAVDQSLAQLCRLREQRIAELRPRIAEEERRLRHWFERWATRIDEQMSGLPPTGNRATRLRQQRDEMERYLRDREEHWKNAYLRAADEPSTRLVLVIEGIR
jgi:ERCC4-related helicase